jgi:MFS family permease
MWRSGRDLGSQRPEANSNERCHALIVASVMVPLMFVCGLDSVINSVAWRAIGDSLDGFEQQAWVNTAFLVAAAVATPFWAKLADIRGRPRFLAAALILFAVGTALCGVAQSMPELAIWRAAQGAGSAGAWPITQAFVQVAIPPKDRGRYIGWFMSAWVAGLMLSPLAGMAISTEVIAGLPSWRWLFFIQVPFILANLMAVPSTRRLPNELTYQRMDGLGAGTLILVVVPLALAPQFVRSWGWDSAALLVCIGVALLGCGAFHYSQQIKADESIIPLAMLRNTQFRLGLPALMLGYFATASVAFVLPLYWQISRGASPEIAGWLVIPQTLGTLAGSFIESISMSRTGRYKPQAAIGFGLLAVGLSLIVPLGLAVPWALAGVGMLLYGLGIGLAFTPLEVSLQRSVPSAQYATAAGTTMLVKNVVYAIAVSAQLALLFGVANSQIMLRMQQDSTALPPGTTFDLNDTSNLAKLPEPVRHSIETGFAQATWLIIFICFLLAILSLATVLAMRETRFETRPRATPVDQA